MTMSIMSAKICNIFKGYYFQAGHQMSVSSPFPPYVLCSSKAGDRAAVFPAVGHETESAKGIRVSKHG